MRDGTRVELEPLQHEINGWTVTIQHRPGSSPDRFLRHFTREVWKALAEEKKAVKEGEKEG